MWRRFLGWLRRFLGWLGVDRTPPPKPFFTAGLKGEKRDMLVYQVEIKPVHHDSDVVHRHLNVVVNGKARPCLVLPRETAAVGGLKFHDGDHVVLELRDVDEAGNESAPAVCDLGIVADTIPPSAPEGFVATQTGEVPDTENPHEVEAHAPGRESRVIGPQKAIEEEPELPTHFDGPSRSKDDGEGKSVD